MVIRQGVVVPKEFALAKSTATLVCMVLVLMFKLPRPILPVVLLNVIRTLPANAVALLNCSCVFAPPGLAVAVMPVKADPLPIK